MSDATIAAARHGRRQVTTSTALPSLQPIPIADLGQPAAAAVVPDAESNAEQPPLPPPLEPPPDAEQLAVFDPAHAAEPDPGHALVAAAPHQWQWPAAAAGHDIVEWSSRWAEACTDPGHFAGNTITNACVSTPTWLPDCGSADPCPFHPRFVEQYLRRNDTNPSELSKAFAADALCQGGQTRGANRFAERAGTVVLMSQIPPEDRIPKDVPYRRPCGCLCKADYMASALQLQDDLKSAWVELAKAHSHGHKLANVCSADLMLCHQVSYGPDSTRTTFASPLEGSGRHGIHHDELTFTMCCVLQTGVSLEPPFRGLRLRDERGPFVEPGRRFASPLGTSNVGPLNFKTDDELSASLVHDDFEGLASEIKILRLDWVLLDGEHDGYDTIEVKGVAETTTLHPREVEKKKAASKPAPLEDDSDFMSIFASRPQRRGQGGRGPGPRPGGLIGDTVSDTTVPMADDPDASASDMIVRELAMLMEEFGVGSSSADELHQAMGPWIK